MTDDDIIRVAQEAGITMYTRVPIRNDKGELVVEKCWHDRPTGCLFDFARRIRAEALEEAAHLCDIREREYDTHTSQTNRGAAIGARYCASAIRALAKG